jgi:hypothetical protein
LVFCSTYAKKNSNDWREAVSFQNKINRQPVQTSFL